LKGQYGDDFRWYGDVKREDGVVTICPAVKDMQGMSYDQSAQWLMGAGYLPDKREESRLDVAVGQVLGSDPAIGTILPAGSKVVLIVSKAGTKEQLIEALKSDFGSVDSNGDGQVSWLEASAKYPGLTQEVFNQVDTNSDGSISKSEAGIAGQEGEGSVQPTEGEGSTDISQTPQDTSKQSCGCGGKSSGNDMWWKYILDVILFGMVIVSMSGMRRRR
ncbi:MAG: PASTA domain-containing protein, partial [Candidatus Hydrogenedens sp.]|nr:PASTA domain-containing protein [Candidatus Hydrogenedens sp.]